MADLILRGRLWVLNSGEGLLSDIDTDMIYHNAHLAVTDTSLMGQYAFGNLEGFEDFSEKAQPGDLILAGDNFGSGSSRQHAVDCFASLGIRAVAARSFGAIYKRNAINSGFPIVELPGIPDDLFSNFQKVQLDLEKGEIQGDGESFSGIPMTEVALDIYMAGGLFEYAKTL